MPDADTSKAPAPAPALAAPAPEEPAGLLIALNAADGLWRPAVCRLAAEVERWAWGSDLPPPRLAVELGVPEDQLRRALAVVPEAARLAELELERAAGHGAAVLTRRGPGYPAALTNLALPPPVLYCQGALPTGAAVAIVGSRRTGDYGRETAETFARALAQAGLAVVSGFARGIDAAAHRGALAGPGATVAVLGCGLGVSYPRTHRTLGELIVAGGGALVTEFRCGTLPRPWNFPVRNRVIAALSLGTLVVEAAPRSGSLITARHALELGREVWAVPGRIWDERALGPNTLIRDGAALVQHPRDILEFLRVTPLFGALGPAVPREPVPGAPEEPPLPGLPGKLLAALPSGTDRPAEAFAVDLDVPVDQVLAALLELELAGRVQRVPGPAYRREG